VSAVLERDFVRSLRTVLRAYIPESPVHLQRIGRVLDLHPRTLQRRLKSLGTSFQKILDEARFELACERLQEDREPLADIAAELGYGEHAAFTKAFRRWAGVSPSRYRDLAPAGSPPRESASDL